MFSYYGSKSKIVSYYPPPKYGKIIEPFAGSARYSLKYWDNEVLLVDKYEVVVRIWKWLQKCSKQDILGLPKFKPGIDLRKCNLSEDELLFLGMCAGVASTTPRYKVSPFANEQNGNKNRFIHIANKLEYIRHWEIVCMDYKDIPNAECTWFIDPPYQFGGEHYKHGTKDIDFNKLAEWCKSRNGQVIVCENTKADWLDFKPMIQIQGACQTNTTEAIWSNYKTNYDAVQQSLLF